MSLRLAFMGTPDFAVPALAEIIAAGHEVAAVCSQPPRPAGRGMEPRKSPVHAFAEGLAIEVTTPVSLKDEAEQRRLAGLDLDAAVVVAYGLILPPAVLAAPAHGCLNIHASLLPRWRGAAPIARAIMAGDAETGVTVMRMDEGLDTGPMCLAERTAISPQTTAGELHDRLARLGAGLIVRALSALEHGMLDCQGQPADGATYAAKIDKAETRIDFARPARDVAAHIMGLSPHPGAWLELPGDGVPVRLKVLRAETAQGAGEPGTVVDDNLAIACAQGAVRFTEVQRAGKAPASAADFLRGRPVAKGTSLG